MTSKTDTHRKIRPNKIMMKKKLCYNFLFHASEDRSAKSSLDSISDKKKPSIISRFASLRKRKERKLL